MEQKLNLTISAIDRATGTLRTVKSSVVDLGSATSRLAPQFAAVNQGLAELSQMAAGAAQTASNGCRCFMATCWCGAGSTGCASMVWRRCAPPRMH